MGVLGLKTLPLQPEFHRLHTSWLAAEWKPRRRLRQVALRLSEPVGKEFP